MKHTELQVLKSAIKDIESAKNVINSAIASYALLYKEKNGHSLYTGFFTYKIEYCLNKLKKLSDGDLTHDAAAQKRFDEGEHGD